MLNRREFVAELLAVRAPDTVVVSGLGSPTWDVAAAGDHDHNFHFIGTMGLAASFALGVALAQPERRVILITGDGELLMGIGTLATIATQAPANLALLVLDNEAYLETGGQATATAGSTDLALLGRGAGIADTRTVARPEQVADLIQEVHHRRGPHLAVVKIEAQREPFAFPHSFDGVTAINRLRRAIAPDQPI